MPVEALMRCGVFRTVMHSCGTCLHQFVHFLLMVQTAGVFILCNPPTHACRKVVQRWHHTVQWPRGPRCLEVRVVFVVVLSAYCCS